ncbi:MAG: hypothetical protein MUE67_04120 [Anaerolineales bacterium]|jgi:hypothetical protein|nr:hypothetical protein [Anaerolineales bacterium]
MGRPAKMMLQQKLFDRLAVGLILTVILAVTWTAVQAAITLLYFTATPGNQQVRLNWATATEIDNAGFYVQRSSQPNTGYARIHSEIILAKGDNFTGSTYEYLDSGLPNGAQFWYRLESIDFSQQSQFSNPILAVVGVPVTPSPSLSPSPTATLSGTRQAPISTFTPLPPGMYPGPQNTPGSPPVPIYPLPGDAQPVAAEPTGLLPPAEQPQTGLAQDNGGEVQLMPFPTVTILFPTVDPQGGPTVPPPPGSTSGLLGQVGLSRFWPLGLLAIAWLALAGWYYYFTRSSH